MQRMKILLQQKDTGLYFKDVGSWTRLQPEAMDFVSSTAALDFCAQNNITGVQMVLKFDEQVVELVMPMAASGDVPQSRPTRSP
jgi:hypothetical protein